MKQRLFLALLLFAGSSGLFALQVQPGSSAALVVGPVVPAVAATASPSNSITTATNPAVFATADSPSFGFGYSGLLSVGNTYGYTGTSIRGGATLPTEYGVSNVAAQFLSAPGVSGLGTLGLVNVSIAKALYPSLLIGAGLGFALGEGSRFDWGLGMNLGVIGLEKELGPLKDFEWSASFEGLGKLFEPYPGTLSPLPAFTPSVQSGFALYSNRNTRINLYGFVQAPQLQDLRFGLGSTLAEAGRLGVRLQAALDLRDLLVGALAFPLSGGIGVTLRLGNNSSRRVKLSPDIDVTPVSPGLYAVGGAVSMRVARVDHTPPAIKLDAPELSYISPNGDGVKDALIVPLSITDNGQIAGYKMSIYDAAGSLVTTIASPSLAISASGGQGVLDRLLYVKQGLPTPKSISWNGTNEQGKVVSDGRYTYTVSAWDAAGNRATTEPRIVIVDTKPPQLRLIGSSGSHFLFSPDGDGYKDTLSISQGGSAEPLWTGTFRDASGKPVRTLTWRSSPPQSFVWNGRGNGGEILPDGSYSYTLSSTDRAGNRASATIHSIMIDTTHPQVRLDVNRSAISPGTSSPYQLVTYAFVVPRPANVASWQLEITNAKGIAVRRVQGGNAVPNAYAFDGTDSSGRPLPNGTYGSVLGVIYDNGAHCTARGPVVAIDRTSPTAQISTSYTVFSPIGTGERSSMLFRISASSEPQWRGTIATGGGNVVEQYDWTGTPPKELRWNGRGPGGRVEPNGSYQFSVSATDEAGNIGQSNVVSFVLETGSKHLLLSTDYAAFSPDGIRNLIRIIPDVRTPKGLVSYRINVINGSDKVFGSFEGTGVPTGSFAWNGQGPDGASVPAGEYRAEMTATYADGSVADATSPAFTVITALPHLTVSSDYSVFSPNGDGHRDSVTFYQHSSGGNQWVGRIENSRGKTVLEKRWQGSLPASFTWLGTDSVGNTVANGSYDYVLKAVDEAGNPAEATASGIVVDNRHTQVYISAERFGFSPNGDGVDDTLSLNTVEHPATGIASWTVTILDSGGKPVRVWSGSNAPPAAPTVWNGSLDSGAIAPDGSYSARFVVHYKKGDVDTATTRPFLLVAHPPKITVTLSPQPFKAGAGSELTIGLSVQSLSPIARWRLEIYTPPIEEHFAALSGLGAPPHALHWDGRSDSGSLVLENSVYSYHLTVVDSLGNGAMVTGNITTGGSH